MYREHVLLPNGLVIEVLFAGKERWKLCLKKGKKILLEYGSESGHAFKSVEQLRYEFETDVENAKRKSR